MAKIYYLCPDYEPPSGGTRRLYSQVWQLRQRGLDAYIVHQKSEFRLTWHGIDVPTRSLADPLGVQENDVLVVPEPLWAIFKQLSSINITKLLIVLNWAPSYWNLPLGENWSDYGVQAVLTPSQVIADYVKWRMNMPVHIFGSYINQKLYSYDAKSKQPLIAYTPRKCPDADIIRSVLEKKTNLFGQFSWQPMIDMSETEYAQQLRQATFYLTPSAREGFNISVLEAMACGCIVIGYHGVGGREYMIGTGDKQNCILVENGDLPQFGHLVEKVLIHWQNNPQPYTKLIKNAIATASQYQNSEREAQQLSQIFQQFLPLKKPKT